MKLLLITLLLWCATPADEECGLIAPNTITANCDKVRCFEITANCRFDHFELQIFNRWGNQMVKKETSLLEDINNYCDSLLTNNKYSAVVYVFWLKADNVEGTKVDKKWSVTLNK
jgi:hypothetical protein